MAALLARRPRLVCSPMLFGVSVTTASVSVAAYLLWRRHQRALSQAPTSCCPPGSLPQLLALSAGEAPERGAECQQAGLAVYVTGAPNPQRAVVVMTDIWGFSAGRHRQVCDILAESLRCTVYMPDLFHGDPCTPDKGPTTSAFATWVKQWPPARVGADLDRLLATLPQSCKVGVVGFCWGSYAALLAAAAPGSQVVSAACFAHPSHRKIMEAVHGIAPADVGEYYLGAIRSPTLCLAAGNDDPRCKPGGADEAILQMAGVPTSFVEFESMAHGWVIKGDLADPETAQSVRRSIGLIGGWLEEHL